MKTATIVLLFAALPLFAIAADDPPALTHNPFSRPSSEVSYDIRRVSDRDDSPDAVPVLRATIVGGANRLANVQGRILKAGDEIHGYTLAEVFEDYAVFHRDGKRLVVLVKPHLADDNE